MKYEKWSLGYWCFKLYVKFADWLIHKRVIVTGKEKIPNNKPIVFAPNHQNALSDPMAVLLHTNFQPVWLARADIFKSKLVSAILRFLKIMPVYRLRDGKENLVKNDQTFSSSVKVLANNFALALFPEAAHSGKRQMMVHKKAVPRIVFMAEEKSGFDLDIQIIPTGIYYSHYWKFDRSVVVNFGDAIPVKDYVDLYKENPNEGIIALKSKIYESIFPLIIDFRTKKYYQDFENIREIYGKHFLESQGKKCSTLNLFKSDQILAKRLDKLEVEQPDEAVTIVSETQDYLTKIKRFKLRGWVVNEKKNNFLQIVINQLVLLIGLPVFIYGFLLNAIPFFTIDRIIRSKVSDKTFWSTFFLVAGIILFPLVYLIEFFVLAGLIPGFWLQMAFLLSMPFAGKLAFKWYILFRKTAGRSRFLTLKLFHRKEYTKLIEKRENLFNRLDAVIPD